VKTSLVYIGLGSNLNEPYQQIKTAIVALDTLPENSVIVSSGYYSSKPMGPNDQPDFVNAVVKMETALSPQALLLACQQIELQQGRIKTRHWGERSIDLDILLYAQQQLEGDNLSVPHPGICARDFVYLPLLEIAPDIVLPGTGELAKIIESQASVDSRYGCQFVGKIE